MTSVNAGLSVDWVRRQFDSDVPKRPTAPEAAAPHAAGTAPVTPIQLPVTPTYARLDLDGSALRIGREARPTTTLSAAEILRSAPERRAELLRRHRDFLAHVSGASTTTAPRRPVTTSRAGFDLVATERSVRIDAPDGRWVEVDLADPERPRVTSDGKERGAAMERLIEGFEALLVGRGALGIRFDPKPGVKALFAYLLGPGGALNPQATPNVPQAQRFDHGKLVCWDFNGTVERERNAGFRPDIGFVTDNLNQMGALSVITTSVDPRAVEETMVRANLHFNAYFGADEVRPTRGKKQYAGVAAAYGLDAKDAPHHMVTIGDSATDQSADLAGVVFLNSDSDTPAEVIQRFLYQLDRAGDGSFARGLERTLSRALDAEPQSLRLGELAFDVALDDANGAPCPKVTNLRVALDTHALLDVLAAPAPRHDLDGAASYAMALRHLENDCDETTLAAVARNAHRAAEPDAVLASLSLRQSRRDEEIRVARAAASGIDAWLNDHPSAEEVERLVDFIVRAGDRDAFAQLEAWAPTYAARTDACANAAHVEIAADFTRIDAAIAGALARPTKRQSPGRDRARFEAIQHAAERLPGSADRLVKLLEETEASSDLAPGLEALRKVLPELERLAHEGSAKQYADRAKLDVSTHLRGGAEQAEQRRATWMRNEAAFAHLAAWCRRAS
ncbi:MAG: hypothetical protein RMA76_23700 [Deltaproteobacteria bacterium]|jgi:hypothetical protein